VGWPVERKHTMSGNCFTNIRLELTKISTPYFEQQLRKLMKGHMKGHMKGRNPLHIRIMKDMKGCAY